MDSKDKRLNPDILSALKDIAIQHKTRSIDRSRICKCGHSVSYHDSGGLNNKGCRYCVCSNYRERVHAIKRCANPACCRVLPDARRTYCDKNCRSVADQLNNKNSDQLSLFSLPASPEDIDTQIEIARKNLEESKEILERLEREKGEKSDKA